MQKHKGKEFFFSTFAGNLKFPNLLLLFQYLNILKSFQKVSLNVSWLPLLSDMKSQHYSNIDFSWPIKAWHFLLFPLVKSCWQVCSKCYFESRVFYKISVRRSKCCLEFSIAWGQLQISRWPFYWNLLQFSEAYFLTFHAPSNAVFL